MATMQGKSVLVTGGGSGIGRATALRFAAEGATVMIGNRNEDAGQQTVELIRAAGGIAEFRKTDVKDEEQIKALIDQTISTFGGLHAAFNNSGVARDMVLMADAPNEDYEQIFDINVRGVWWCMKHQINYMLDHGGGSIVNTASILGVVGMPEHGLYAASKHAVMGLTRSAALEYGAKGIRINAVCPAAIMTPMLRAVIGDDPEQQEQIKQAMTSMHPIGRVGKPEEVAAAVVWLCSKDASFMLGHGMMIDGGFTAI